MGCSGEVEIAIWFWFKEDIFIACLSFVIPNARDTPIEPLSDCSVAIVVERVHHNIAKAVFVRVAIPTFPHCCCALSDWVQPRWVSCVIDEPVSQVGSTEARKNWIEQRCADKPSVEMIICFFESFYKVSENLFA